MTRSRLIILPALVLLLILTACSQQDPLDELYSSAIWSETSSFNDAPVSNKASGLVITSLTAAESVALGDTVYINGSGQAAKSDASSTATLPAMAIAASDIAKNESGRFLTYGYARMASWSFSPGLVVYADAIPGQVSQIAPSGAGKQLQIIGIAVSEHVMLFNPQLQVTPAP